MKFTKYCVQFLWRVSDNDPNHMGLFLTQLIHAGAISVVKEEEDKDDPTATNGVYQLRPPQFHRTIDTKVWADQEAKRMRSFGINAEPVRYL